MEQSEHIDLTVLIKGQRIKTSESFEASIEAHQEEIVDRLPSWMSAETYPKELVISIGRTTLTVIRVKRPPLQSGETMSPMSSRCFMRAKVQGYLTAMRKRSSSVKQSRGAKNYLYTYFSFLQDVGSRLLTFVSR